ncbi:MAG: hypothetical protein ACRDWE_13070 [Acidimicrobiales bacterium]
MPTTRPRHVITETDEVARALDAAARRWPEDRNSRAKLMLRLVAEGYQALGQTDIAVATERRDALRRTSGLLTGVYGSGYLEELRSDWPE